MRDMVAWLSLSSGLKPERSLQSNGLITTLSQHYFLFLGTLSANPHGVKLLEKCSLFQWYVGWAELLAKLLFLHSVEFVVNQHNAPSRTSCRKIS